MRRDGRRRRPRTRKAPRNARSTSSRQRAGAPDEHAADRRARSAARSGGPRRDRRRRGRRRSRPASCRSTSRARHRANAPRRARARRSGRAGLGRGSPARQRVGVFERSSPGAPPRPPRTVRAPRRSRSRARTRSPKEDSRPRGSRRACAARRGCVPPSRSSWSSRWWPTRERRRAVADPRARRRPRDRASRGACPAAWCRPRVRPHGRADRRRGQRSPRVECERSSRFPHRGEGSGWGGGSRALNYLQISQNALS